MSLQVNTLSCGPYGENAYLVWMEGRDDCVIVDPGGGLPFLKRALGGRTLSAILLTHGHFDHTLAAQPLREATGAPIYIHAEDVEMLADPALNAYDMEAADLPHPGRVDAQPYGEALSAAGMDFQILHTPGHSKGSVCLYLPKENALFSGDTLFRAGFGRMDLYGGSPMAMRRSLKTLFELPPETRVYPGHDADTTIQLEKARYRL